MRRGAIDATEFAKRVEARREQRRIELDAVDKTRDADLAALRRSFRKRDEAAGDAVSSDSSSDSSDAAAQYASGTIVVYRAGGVSLHEKP